MKKILSAIILAIFVVIGSPAFAAPPPEGHGHVHPGHEAPPPARAHHQRIHGSVAFNMPGRHICSHGGYYYNGCNSLGYYNNCCNCPGIYRPFRHPGPLYSTGFYINF